MKRILPLLLAFLALPLSAQIPVQMEADVHFHGAVVNNEFDASNEVLSRSLTIAAVRFAPYVGLKFGEQHHLKAGVNVLRDFGTPGQPLSAEMAVWYQMDRKHFTLAAGIFPRSLLKYRYSDAVLGDKVRFYDALLEGFLLQWHKGRSRYEIALDWNGMKGEGRREQFNVITAGVGSLTPWLSLNWEGMFHHYASSLEVQGVVDDIFFHPFVSADFASFTGLQRLVFQVGPMMGYQYDRIQEDRRLPIGADIVIDAKKWGVGIRNEAYYGGSQAPFFGKADAAGNRYATNLYMRNSLWQITPDGSPGFYDRLDLYWMPFICKEVTLQVRLVAHFGYGGFIGHQQVLEAIVNLDQIRIHKHKK